MNTKPRKYNKILPIDDIIEKYTKQGLTIAKIAKLYNVSHVLIQERLKDANINEEEYLHTKLENEKRIYIEKAQKRHNNYYVYDLTNFKTYKSIIDITCKIHGKFKQKAIYHIDGAGCTECGRNKISQSKKHTVLDFILKANIIHNNYYDYSEAHYETNYVPLIIICPKHGSFIQTPGSHLQGAGCPKCAQESTNQLNSLSLNEFLDKSKRIYNNLYQYECDNFINRLSIVKILCPTHGHFNQKASLHLKGKGCPKCSREKYTSTTYLNEADFMERASNIHNNKYDYNETHFKGIINKAKIICPVHGEFLQQIAGHLQGSGCPLCGKHKSKYEDFIKEYLTENNIEYKEHYKLHINETDWFELDFYIPEQKMAIEVNGIFWHSELAGRDKKYHLKKTEECNKQNIQLIHIFTHLIQTKPDIIKYRLTSLLNLNNIRIFARNCVIKELTYKQSNVFLKDNHLQGSTKAPINIGLFYDNILVSVMTFGHTRKALGGVFDQYSYELLRFACKGNHTVIGGASKLLNYFERKYKPHMLTTYADRCWSTGVFYLTIGFQLDHYSSPSYWYFKDNDVYHRYRFAKHTLKKQLPIFDPLLSEWENMKNNRYNRFWDCGNYVFKKVYQQ